MDRDQEAIERWFIRRGIPHAIDDYRPTTDVLTRAAPFLGLVFIVEVFTSFGGRFEGLAQAGVFVAGLAILLLAAALLNRSRGRAWFQLPDRIGLRELVVFLVVPPVLPALAADDPWLGALRLFLVNLVVLGLAYLVTSYGLVPMLRWNAVRTADQIGDIATLMAKSLPLLLVFSMFLFINAEVWQVVSDIPPLFYGLVVGATAGLGMVFVSIRIPSELVGLARFETWDEVCDRANESGSPLGHVERPPGAVDPPLFDPLSRRDRINVGLLMFFAQAVRLLLVGVVVGAFFVLFGMLTIRETTILHWTTMLTPAELDPVARFSFGDNEIVLTWELFGASGFIGALSALQYSVQSVTDARYREDFYEDLIGEIREVMAVRVLYLTDLGRSNTRSIQ